MLIRQTAPVLGAATSPYQQPGEWQVNVSMRTLTSDTHYRLDDRQNEREELGTFVINKQNALDISGTYAFTERLSVAVAVPFVSASWAIPTPTSPPGPRAQQDGQGLGDISVTGRYWLFDTRSHRDANVAIGLGVKMPTGEYAEQDMYPDRNGQNNQLRYVDQSVQPGDGGWGLMLEAQGFKRFGRVQVFGSGNYLANPRDTNGTPSLTVARLPPGATPAATQFDRLVNSVPDQYLARVGGAVGVKRGFAVTTAYRVEGQRRYDLIGKSHGFRRPGVAMFIEPGVSIGTGRQTLSLTVPIAFYQNRKPDPYTGIQGDATFPKYIVLGSYGFRFGGRTAPTHLATPSP